MNKKDNQSIQSIYEESYQSGENSRMHVDKFFTINADENHYDEMKQIFNTYSSWKGKKVLEIGCGEGELASLIASVGGNVTAVDYSESAIQTAKSHYNLENLHFSSIDYKDIKEEFDDRRRPSVCDK